MLSSSWGLSLPQYLLILYPLFIVGVRIARFSVVFIPYILAGAAIQGWLMWMYAAGQWTF